MEIKDEGPGIPKEEHHLLFKKFQPLSNRPTAGESSTGLGLSIVEQLVKKLQGTIHFESSPSKGTLFIVEIPEMGSKN